MARANGGEAMIGEGSAGTAQDHEAIERLLTIAEDHGLEITLEWGWISHSTGEERRTVQATLAQPVYQDAIADLMEWARRTPASEITCFPRGIVAHYRFAEAMQ